MSHPIPPSGQHERERRAPHPRRRGADRVDVARMLSVGGQMAARISGFDWSRTPLGPLEEWPISLRSTAAMVLENRFPMTMFWGPELLHLYNDGYVPVLGGKHPAALGQPASVVWAEIWPIIGPQLAHVYGGKGALWNEHLLLPMDRKGFLEEAYFTFSTARSATTRGRSAASWSRARRRRSRSRTNASCRCSGTSARKGSRPSRSRRPAGRRPGCSGATTRTPLRADLPGAPRDRTDAELVASAGLNRYEGPEPSFDPCRRRRTAGRSRPRPARRACPWSTDLAVSALDAAAAALGDATRAGRDPEPGRARSVRAVCGSSSPGLSPMRVLDERYRGCSSSPPTKSRPQSGAARAFEEERTRVEALAALTARRPPSSAT